MAARSRMNREVHVRICEGLGVKFPGATRPIAPNAGKGERGRRRSQPSVTIQHESLPGVLLESVWIGCEIEDRRIVDVYMECPIFCTGWSVSVAQRVL
jgi:hypothetical protein